jgi:hypothetical protein
MTEAYLILRDFGNRVTEVHLSEVNAASKHEPISYGATLAFQQVASMIPETIPVILESIVSAEFIDDEIEAAHEALAIAGPRPRVRKRRSGATPGSAATPNPAGIGSCSMRGQSSPLQLWCRCRHFSPPWFGVKFLLLDRAEERNEGRRSGTKCARHIV